jgi:hypothetical protein
MFAVRCIRTEGPNPPVVNGKSELSMKMGHFGHKIDFLHPRNPPVVNVKGGVHPEVTTDFRPNSPVKEGRGTDLYVKNVQIGRDIPQGVFYAVIPL